MPASDRESRAGHLTKFMTVALRLPLLLRPFSGSLRRTIEEKVEGQADAPAAFLQHDVFILEELPEGRVVLAGVDRSIVTDALQRYGAAARKQHGALADATDRTTNANGFNARTGSTDYDL